MKTILFCVYGLGIGGIEKCLINLVKKIDKNQYKISIAIMNPEYEMIDELPDNIEILDFENYFVNTSDSYSVISQMPFSKEKVTKFVQYIIYRISVKFRLKPWMIQKKLQNRYDIAVAYSHTGFVPNYVADRVEAKRKILWYHTLWKDRKNFLCYSKYDQIVTVSETCKVNFCEMFPELKNKVLVLNNLYDVNAVKIQAVQDVSDIDKSKKVIVTVARLSEEKGYRLAIDACLQLKISIGNQFNWYWIGDGPGNADAIRLIEKKDVGDVFHLLGNRNNPYPYMKKCDIYVQPSKSEAYCTTVMEAKILKKAIVTTNVNSFFEQINNGIDGVISNMDDTSLSMNIERLVKDKSLREIFEKNSDFELSQEVVYEKYIDFLEGKV